MVPVAHIDMMLGVGFIFGTRFGFFAGLILFLVYELALRLYQWQSPNKIRLRRIFHNNQTAHQNKHSCRGAREMTLKRFSFFVVLIETSE
jgi:hypothetical protein